VRIPKQGNEKFIPLLQMNPSLVKSVLVGLQLETQSL